MIGARYWMAALDSQMAALRKVQSYVQGAPSPAIAEIFTELLMDVVILRDAVPFMWGDEPVSAVIEASVGVPKEATLDKWNLDTNAIWWHFEKPIDLPTTVFGYPLSAISMGWMLQAKTNAHFFVVSCWVYAPRHGGLNPSQMFSWIENESLGDLMERLSREYELTYGPAGKWKDRPKVGKEEFLRTAETLARFVLSAFAWLEQKVLVEESGIVERHARKDYARRTGKLLDAVKIVQLRRTERSEKAEEVDALLDQDDKRKYTCRWVVDGHWRLAKVGAGRTQTRLTYVHSYVKGPDDMPLRTPSATVYLVDR